MVGCWDEPCVVERGMLSCWDNSILSFLLVGLYLSFGWMALYFPVKAKSGERSRRQNLLVTTPSAFFSFELWNLTILAILAIFWTLCSFMNILAISRHLLFFGLNRLDKLSPIDQNNIMKHKKTFQIGTFLVSWRFTMFWRSIQSRAWNQTKTIIGRYPQNPFKIALQIWLRSFYSSLFQSNPVTFLIESFFEQITQKKSGGAYS